jgi:acyl-CoA reductase-like NAD-dependent aldehyde dehydrogenase
MLRPGRARDWQVARFAAGDRRTAVHGIGARRTVAAPAVSDTPNKILALEMGGNNPLVVGTRRTFSSGGDLRQCRPICLHGQRCTAARRTDRQDGAHEPLIEAMAKIIERIVIDHPHANPAPFMGPVIDNRPRTGCRRRS